MHDSLQSLKVRTPPQRYTLRMHRRHHRPQGAPLHKRLCPHAAMIHLLGHTTLRVVPVNLRFLTQTHNKLVPTAFVGEPALCALHGLEWLWFGWRILIGDLGVLVEFVKQACSEGVFFVKGIVVVCCSHTTGSLGGVVGVGKGVERGGKGTSTGSGWYGWVLGVGIAHNQQHQHHNINITNGTSPTA